MVQITHENGMSLFAVDAGVHWPGSPGVGFIPLFLCDGVVASLSEPHFSEGTRFCSQGPLLALRPRIWVPLVRMEPREGVS